MCGITGAISDNPVDIAIVCNMTNNLIHRGPNDYGYLCSNKTKNTHLVDRLDYLNNYTYPNFAFGHRRLSIQDLTQAGHQPMEYMGRYWIVYNGEIYNFIELRNELEEKGYQFKSHTDSEIILAAYDTWGVDCLNKFNGDWAFVVLDTLSNKIFISRDRFGIKPLYYYAKEGLFVFASEIKSLLAHPFVTKKPNIQYLREYIKYGPKEYIRETAFEHIYHFDFATYFEGKVEDLLCPNKIRLKKFWSIKPNLSCDMIDENRLIAYSRQYYELLEDSVKLRLRSDVKVGSSLSGGLDSSSIVYLINKNGHSIETFSSIYKTLGTAYCDESYFINHLSASLSVKSNQIEPPVADIPEEHRKMIYYLDTPPDSTLMSSWYTYKLQSHSGIVVTLDGQGADEQLAGYLFYLINFVSSFKFLTILRHLRHFKKIPNSRRYLLLGMMINFSKRLFGKKITQFIYQLTGRKDQITIHAAERLHQTFTSYLVTLFHIDDRASMAHSVEVRMPFMDYRLVEFLNSIPISYKLSKGWTKYLARISFKNRIPDTVVWRKDKLGWPVPDNFWFENKHKDWMEDTIKNSSFIKKYKFFSVKKFKKASMVYKVRLLNLAVWHNIFFN